MKKIIVAAAISMVALVGCTSQAEPTPTVTVTEQAPDTTPVEPPITPDEGMSSAQDFIFFVKENGGPYAQVASYQDLVDLGSTICEGFAGGLSEDEITYVLAQALVNNNMDNDDGAKFGAALIVGAKNYLCGINTY